MDATNLKLNNRIMPSMTVWPSFARRWGPGRGNSARESLRSNARPERPPPSGRRFRVGFCTPAIMIINGTRAGDQAPRLCSIGQRRRWSGAGTPIGLPETLWVESHAISTTNRHRRVWLRLEINKDTGRREGAEGQNPGYSRGIFMVYPATCVRKMGSEPNFVGLNAPLIIEAEV
ncbi:hypothetical protein BD779DRAFT_1786764 [Infundibulicybe gibba]|nr:hypothetical protein BD779DRAFT_1786764 [Infundibulicybe gibba]